MVARPTNGREAKHEPSKRREYNAPPTFRPSTYPMSHIHKVATLNINGLATPTRPGMLEDFLRKQEIDLAFLQEVTHTHTHTHTHLDTIQGYTAHMNVGTERRGTAILAKEGITLTNVKRLPSGTGIATMYEGLWLVNVYAPSWTARRQDRETFYNSDLPYLLPYSRTDMILAGDFNCVLADSDSTGRRNYSRALASVVHGFNLTDAWEATPPRKVYTHYTPTGALELTKYM